METPRPFAPINPFPRVPRLAPPPKIQIYCQRCLHLVKNSSTNLEQCACCRRILYNQPDFADAESLLKTNCHSCRIHVVCLPKFHCELNFIEQCWGRAKGVYRTSSPPHMKMTSKQTLCKRWPVFTSTGGIEFCQTHLL